MILNQIGDKLAINDELYLFVGETVLVSNCSIYSGMIGKITEIRTEKDLETDNLGPDIYVDFGEGEVIMAADMLEELPF